MSGLATLAWLNFLCFTSRIPEHRTRTENVLWNEPNSTVKHFPMESSAFHAQLLITFYSIWKMFRLSRPCALLSKTISREPWTWKQKKVLFHEIFGRRGWKYSEACLPLKMNLFFCVEDKSVIKYWCDKSYDDKSPDQNQPDQNLFCQFNCRQSQLASTS